MTVWGLGSRDDSVSWGCVKGYELVFRKDLNPFGDRSRLQGGVEILSRNNKPFGL